MKYDFMKSQHVLGFEYDPKAKVITVEFRNGAKYTHSAVPPEAVANFQNYRSPGEFYHGIIKNYPLTGKTNK